LSKTDQKKRIARVKKSVGKIDNMEITLWFGITVAYVVFVAMLSGMTKAWLPELLYLGPIPIDPQYGVWAFMIALWIPMSLMLQAYFKRT
jgi:hypothetical protein